MKAILIGIMLTASAFSALYAGADGLNIDQCQIANQTIKKVSVIRGLTIRKAVPCVLHDKAEVEKYLRKELSVKVPTERLKAEETVYKSLGFIPDQYQYAQGIIDLYLSQLGGYYDPELKRYVMAAWIPSIMQTTIAAHELTHALQDQYFNLSNFIDPKQFSSDQQLARSALVEGDATAVMLDFTREMMGQKPIATEDNVESIMMQNVIGASLSSSMSSVPQALQMLLIFPYTSGLRFAHERLKVGGYAAVDQVFKSPPRSTEEILHPEKYGQAQADYREVTPEELSKALGVSVAPSYTDTLGEFGIAILLGSYLHDKQEAASAAAGWGGDRVGVFPALTTRPGDAASYIVWKIAWDREADLVEFVSHFNEAMSTRYQVNQSVALNEQWSKVSVNRRIKLQREGLNTIFIVENAVDNAQ